MKRPVLKLVQGGPEQRPSDPPVRQRPWIQRTAKAPGDVVISTRRDSQEGGNANQA